MFSIFESLVFIVFPIVFIACDAVCMFKEYMGLQSKFISDEEA